MNEVKFENEYNLSKEFVDEIVIKLLKKRIIIGYVIGVFNLIFFLLSEFVMENDAFFNLGISIGCFMIAIFFPMLYSKRIIENSKLSNNGVISKTIVKFDNNIKIDKGVTHTEYEYNQIYGLIETKNAILIVLKLKANSRFKLNLILSKNGFVKRKFK